MQWVRAHPDIEQKIWPDRHWLTPEEKDEAVNQILGISDDYEITGPGHRPSSTPAETPALAGEGDPGDDANPPENPAQSD